VSKEIKKTITINPIARVHGDATMTLEIKGDKIIRARTTSLYVRGFEKILVGRDPLDAPYLTQRICGICSAAHGVAASLALENMAQAKVPNNGLLLRNIAFAVDIIMNHITFLYVLALPDYFRPPSVSPLVPNPTKDYRLPAQYNQQLGQSYLQALTMRAIAHQLAALWSGKAPHQHGMLAGGFPLPPTAERVLESLSLLAQLKGFIIDRMLPDLELVGEFYPEYWLLGQGYGRLISYPTFPLDNRGTTVFKGGRVVAGKVLPLCPDKITEDVTRSWYRGGEEAPATGHTDIEPDKDGAYSWIKAPRYQGLPYETGPLARMWINGYWRRGLSALDRLMARAVEAKLIVNLIEDWLNQIQLRAPTFKPIKLPREGRGLGLTGAMRGALGHWVEIRGGRIAHYQIITPSAWNYSPADAKGQPGPVEKALEKTPVADPDNPVEAGRILRSFDPCYSCAVHTVTAKQEKLWRVL